MQSVFFIYFFPALIYLQFFLNLITQAEGDNGGLICKEKDAHGDPRYGCQIGNKVVGWIITAVFCGLYGMFFVIPTSIGNVQGKTYRIYISLVVTAIYAYAPFVTLILYKQGVPHNAVVHHEYEIVCPGILITLRRREHSRKYLRIHHTVPKAMWNSMKNATSLKIGAGHTEKYKANM